MGMKMNKWASLALVAAAVIALVGTPVAAADSGPQPKVEHVDNVHWSQEADGSETVAYDAATAVSDNLEGDAKKETVWVLKVAHASFPNASSVTVNVMGNMCDKYGACDREPAARWVYQQSTLNRIRYDTVNSDNIWDLADGGEILAKNWT
jgi:uncharacterized protein with LGFP repeats